MLIKDNIIKNLESSFNLLTLLNSEDTYEIQIPEVKSDGIFCALQKNDGSSGFELCLNLSTENKLKIGSIAKLTLKNENINIMLKNSIIKSSTPIFKKNKTIFHYKIDINSLYKEPFDTTEDYYYRLIVPAQKNISLCNYLYVDGYNSGSFSSVNLISTQVNDKHFHLFTYPYADRNFIIIDSLAKINIHDFKEVCFSISLSLGFITSYLNQNEGYYLASSKSDFNEIQQFEYSSLRSNIENPYKIFSTNAYNYEDFFKNKQKCKEAQGELKIIETEVFIKLCNLVHNKSQLMDTILNLFQATNSGLEIQTSLFAVALESLTSMISSENEDKLNPIKTKKLAKEIREKLQETIKSFKKELDEEGFIILTRKIDNINSPTNKDKLLKPFEILGIDLTNDEKDVLSKRNNLLHGRSIIPEEAGNQIIGNIDLFNELFKQNVIFYSCVVKLILKYIGFSGKIVNHQLVYGEDFDKYNDDEVFIDI